MGAVLRVIPHPANFAPIGGLALFGGIYLNRKIALVLPLAAMVVSDFFIGFDSWSSRLVVYGSFLIVGAIGMLIRNRKNPVTILGGAVLGSVIFFLLTNIPFLHPAGLYPNTLEGLFASYVNALSFFRNTLLGDIFYTTIFAGGYEVVLFYQKRKTLNDYQRQGANPS